MSMCGHEVTFLEICHCPSGPRGDSKLLIHYTCPYSCYCIKILVVSYDIRVCNFLIISNTRLQSKERHIGNGRKTYTCKNGYTCNILSESTKQLLHNWINVRLIWNAFHHTPSIKGNADNLYSSLHGIHTTSKRSGMDHTAFNLQRTPCQPLSRNRSPDGDSTECGGGHLIAAHYSFIDP